MSSDVPVLLVHGWGGSFRRTWQEPGWVDVLGDEGRTVIGVDLLGHGDAPKPHDTAAYDDLTARIVDAMGDHTQVDAVGFSLGGRTLLELALRIPDRFRRLVIAGYGESAFRNSGPSPVLAALRGETVDDDNKLVQQFLTYANQPGNDIEALTACMGSPHQRFTPEQMAAITCPTLVVIGDMDFAGPGEPLAEALPHGSLVTIKRLDHFRTTEDFGVIDAVVRFLAS
jgi:pimeloyl-ACP methyl ester carboxylesterase